MAMTPGNYGAFGALMNPKPALGTGTTNAQNMWDWTNAGKNKNTLTGGGVVAGPAQNMGPRPIDEGQVAYERQLEADKTMRDRNAAYASNAAAEGDNRDRANITFKFGMDQQAADANQRRLMDTLSMLGGPFGALFGQNGASAGHVGGGDADWEATLAAQMGRATDSALQAGESAQRGIREEMAQRGLTGSGLEADELAQAKLASAGQIGESGRQIATQRANRAASVADRNYSGNITQRGQDLQAAQSRWSLIPSLMSLFRVSASY